MRRPLPADRDILKSLLDFVDRFLADHDPFVAAMQEFVDNLRRLDSEGKAHPEGEEAHLALPRVQAAYRTLRHAQARIEAALCGPLAVGGEFAPYIDDPDLLDHLDTEFETIADHAAYLARATATAARLRRDILARLDGGGREVPVEAEDEQAIVDRLRDAGKQQAGDLVALFVCKPAGHSIDFYAVRKRMYGDTNVCDVTLRKMVSRVNRDLVEVGSRTHFSTKKRRVLKHVDPA